MDAKERHELKDNDLAEFLEHFGEFWGKHGNWIMGVLTVCMLLWLGKVYWSNTQAKGFENAWADLAATNTPQGYRERATENAGFPAVPQIALLRGAEAYHDQAIKLKYETGGEDTGLMSAEESLKNAVSMYQQVLDMDTSPVYRANAALGLANVQETLGDFTAAREYWEKARQIAEEARLTAIATQARIRMGMLDELASPIVLGEAKPEAESQTDPEAEPKTQAEPEPEEDPVSTSLPADAAATPDTPTTPADPGQ